MVLAGPLTKLVLWDFDGTLAIRPGLWRGCIVEIIERRHPDHVIDGDALRAALHDGFPWHTPDVAHDHADDDAWWTALAPVLERACRAAGLTAGDAVSAASDVRSCFAAADAYVVYEDTVDALTLLRDNGWRHAIVSNHVPELEDLVHGLGLAEYFDAVFTSGRTGYEKPHRRAFELALAHLSPTHVWMVGDNPKADVAGAEALGIPAILVTREQGAMPLLDAARHILASS
ncbi:MAG: hypothetical protein QOI61_1441 [Actinomycetota bacterium]